MTCVAEGLNSHHLKTGEACPPLAKDKLRLYAMRYCPYAERAMIALSIKQIPHEVVNLNLQEQPEWYLQRNPLGKVPAVVQNNKVVFESLVVAEYLDEVYPQHPLLPKDPYERAQQKILTEQLTKLPTAIYGSYRNRDDPKAIATIVEALKFYEDLLHDDFFGGKSPAWADYMAWPWVERLGGLNVVFGNKLPIAEHQKLVAYIARMKARPEIQRVLKSDDAHAKFFRSAMEGKPIYDIECA